MHHWRRLCLTQDAPQEPTGRHSHTGSAQAPPPSARPTVPSRVAIFTHVFLAIGDALAEAAFHTAFGARLRVRATKCGGLNEMHIRWPHNPRCSLWTWSPMRFCSPAVDGCYTWTLNVSSSVAMMAPTTTMVHVLDVLET